MGRARSAVRGLARWRAIDATSFFDRYSSPQGTPLCRILLVGARLDLPAVLRAVRVENENLLFEETIAWRSYIAVRR
jgi:hypothetical protein